MSRERSKIAVGYIRVSSHEQAMSGLSLEEQRREIERAAELHGYELAGIFADEGVSGGKKMDEREGLTEALAGLPRGGALIVSKRDRLGRDYVEVGLIERAVTGRKGRVISASPGEQALGGDPDDPTSVLMRGMLDLFAHFERLMGKVRMKAAARAKKARGEPAGFVEFGQRVNNDGKLEDDPEEQAVIELVVQLRALPLTHRRIVAELNEREIVSKRAGNPFGLSQVQRILSRRGVE